MNNLKRQPKIPEEVLKLWWWRRLIFVKFEEETHTTQRRPYVPEYPNYGFSGEWNMWHKKDELTAFRYEMLRRIAFPELPDWLSLPNWLGGWVEGVIAPKPERSVCGMFAPVAPPDYASIGDWMWDLRASDESLCRHFILFINEERRKHNLPTSDWVTRILGSRTKHGERRRGRRNRQISWLAVEAHDLKSYGVRLLTDGERSRLSKACREMAVFEKPMREAIDMAKRNSPENARIVSSGESLYARFVRENFLERLASRLPKQ